LPDRGEGLDAGLTHVRARFLDARRIQVEADRMGAVLLGRGDDDPPVAAAEVVQEIAAAHVGDGEHLLDHRLRRRHVDDVDLVARSPLPPGFPSRGSVSSSRSMAASVGEASSVLAIASGRGALAAALATGAGPGEPREQLATRAARHTLA